MRCRCEIVRTWRKRTRERERMITDKKVVTRSSFGGESTDPLAQ